MKRARPLGLLIVLTVAFSVTCTDEDQLTAPATETVPLMQTVPGDVDPEVHPEVIDSLIVHLYPAPGLVRAAQQRWANIQRQRPRDPSAAQEQALEMTEDALVLWEDDQLLPYDYWFPSPGDEAIHFEGEALDGVNLLSEYTFEYTGLQEAPIFDQEYLDAPDKGIGIITPESGGEVITENGWASLTVGPGEVDGNLLVTVALDPECDPDAELKSSLGCWDFDQFGADDTGYLRVVEICVADPGPDVLSDQEYFVELRVHAQEEAETTGTKLEFVNSDLDCSGFFVEGELQQAAGQSGAQSILASLGSRVADLLLPDPLSALFQDYRRPPRGIGGLAGSFTLFYGAVPEDGASYTDIPTDPPTTVATSWQMVDPVSAVSLCNDPGGLACPAGTATTVDLSAEAVTTSATEPWWRVHFYYKPHGSPGPITSLGYVGPPSDSSVDGSGNTHWLWSMVLEGADVPETGTIDVFAVGVPDTLVSDDIYATDLNPNITVSSYVDSYADFVVGTGPDASSWEVVEPADLVELCREPGVTGCPEGSVDSVLVSAEAMTDISVVIPPWSAVYFYYKPRGLPGPLTALGPADSYQFRDNGSDGFYTWTVRLDSKDLSETGDIDIFAVGVNGTNVFATGLNSNVSFIFNQVSWWPAEGDYSDASGENDGYPVGPVTFEPGISGDAFAFDGGGGVVDIIPAPGIDGLQELTLSGWVRLNQSGRQDKIQRFVTLLGEKAVLRQDGLTSPSQLHYYMSIDGGLEHIRVDGVLTTQCFHHVAGTYDGTTMRLYLDGEEVGNLPITGTVDDGWGVEFSSEIPQAPGGVEDPLGEALDGRLDEVIVFDRPLTAPEIAAFYQAGGPAKCQAVSAEESVFSLADESIVVGDSTLITLQARDASGNDILGGGANVRFNPFYSALSGRLAVRGVSDNGDGTYSAWLVGLASGLPITIRATVDGEEVTSGDATLAVDPAELTSGQAEALLGSAFQDWWTANHYWNGVAPMLSTAADEHTSSWRNFGMEHASTEPRQAWDNTTEFYYEYASLYPWLYLYRALLSTRDVLTAVGGGLEIGTGGADTNRAVAFGKFVQGLSLGTLALVYDSAFVLDEDTNLATSTLGSYNLVMTAALAKLDEAIALANGNAFTTDPSWMNGTTLTDDDMAALGHSYKARFMAQVARDVTERNAVAWAAVMTEVAAGITADFSVTGGPGWRDALKSYASGGSGTSSNYGTWGRLDVRYLGPADTGGDYQAWLGALVEDRNEIAIETPDRRITGPTWDSDGLYVKYLGPSQFRLDRGTYHFSLYGDKRYDAFVDGGQTGPMVEMTVAEMEYLRAEALIRMGDLAGAAAIVNVNRVNNGELPAVTVLGATGSDCVPRVPDEFGVLQCGDLWEVLKYEKRLEVYHTGLGIAFFDDRGWGDLVAGTFHHLPVPGQELEILGLPYYTYGGTWPTMVAAQTVGAPGQVGIAPETLASYWGGLRARLAALEEEMGAESPTIVPR